MPPTNTKILIKPPLLLHNHYIFLSYFHLQWIHIICQTTPPLHPIITKLNLQVQAQHPSKMFFISNLRNHHTIHNLIPFFTQLKFPGDANIHIFLQTLYTIPCQLYKTNFMHPNLNQLTMMRPYPKSYSKSNLNYHDWLRAPKERALKSQSFCAYRFYSPKAST